MVYNLGKYRYKNGKIYRKGWFFYHRMDSVNSYTYAQGVKIVNSLKRYGMFSLL